jgi:hypothetical protein
MNKTLLSQTLYILEKNGIQEEDVRWIGNHKYWSTWDNFKQNADFTYDSGFGAAEVAQDLMVVGDDWWMTRGEYDGSEWWDFHRKPALPGKFTEFVSFGTGMWNDLAKFNPHIREEGDDYYDEDDD